ncbi:DUF5348 domain-containing protein [Clostridium botulinum]|uniref:DUF5348 domain-containing protein n=1 Tax=Clostridium botulinum TaxID=1491 RepID=A0A140B471_CLOBO|nr:DUF5348 domain-containing protein [Clostridium botulinum]ALP69037.1 hypothetical protein [Clostridium botulinum]MBY7043756.1 DUF5348 domain-containing protein [Clostridium botulinum]
MSKNIGTLGYNYDNDRIGILNDMDLWQDDGLHCGETLEVFINDEWKIDRLEMTWDKVWYLVVSGLKGNQLEGIKIRR